MAASVRLGESLCKICIPHLTNQFRGFSHRIGVSRYRRKVFIRHYPTHLVYPDGSSITIRYKDPRKIIELPLDFEALTEEEQRILLLKRTPKKEKKVVEEFEDDFDAEKYRHVWKKK